MQERFQHYLPTLRFDMFVRDCASADDDLIKLVSVIKQNYAKNHTSWQCEDSKIEVLENAISARPCAHSPVEQLYGDLNTFKDFYCALANSPQKSIKETRGSSALKSSIPCFVYFRKPRYASRTRGFLGQGIENRGNSFGSRGYPRIPFGQSFKPQADCSTAAQSAEVWLYVDRKTDYSRVGFIRPPAPRASIAESGVTSSNDEIHRRTSSASGPA